VRQAHAQVGTGDGQERAPSRTPGAAGRPRKGETEQRRRHLVAVAAELFLEHGYHRVSLALIAREARTAVRTIYLCFGGKAGLFGAVLRAERLRHLDDEHELDPAASIHAALTSFGQRHLDLLADPRVTRLRHMMLAEAGASPELAQSWREIGPVRTRALLARYFADTRVRAQLRPDVPLDLLPAYFVSCIAGEYLWPAFGTEHPGGGRTLPQLLEARLELFLRSVLSASPG
jgi:TetR/AcrR family transcriptional repressor of mexJK operon